MLIKYNNSLLLHMSVPSQYSTIHLIRNKDFIWNRIILFSNKNFFIDDIFYFFDIKRNKKIAIEKLFKDHLKLQYFIYNKSLIIYGDYLYSLKISQEYDNKILQVFDFLKKTYQNP